MIAFTPYLVGGAKYIKDGIEIVKAGKAIFEFIKSIKYSIEKKRRDPSSESREGPWRTMEAMVKTAEKNECDLDFRYSGSNGEKLEARLTHADAVRIRRETEVTNPRYKENIVAEVIAEDIKLLADQIEREGPKGLAESHPLIVAIVRLLRQTRNEHLVEMLAHELESRGQPRWAEEVRKIATQK